MHVLGIFGGLKRWICFVGCIASIGAAAQDWAQFSCPDADFIVPADWQALDTNEKQQIADQADALLRRQRLEGGGSSASKVRHLVMREPSAPPQALIRFVTQRGEFAADVRNALSDDEVFRGVSEAIRTVYPRMIPNLLRFESVSRQRMAFRHFKYCISDAERSIPKPSGRCACSWCRSQVTAGPHSRSQTTCLRLNL